MKYDRDSKELRVTILRCKVRTSWQQQMTHLCTHTTAKQVSISNRESWLTSGSGVCLPLTGPQSC